MRIEFRAEAEDSATGRVLGWQSGIPEVELTLQPEDTTKGGPLSLRGTVEGSLALDSIPPGRYVAVASRWLTEAERGQLPASDDALGFVAKSRVNTADGGTQTVRLAASRKRSLVISEFSFNRKFIPGLEDYPWSGFIELFNNSDTTIYLDGMIVAEGWWASLDAPPNFPCSFSEPYRNDPAGIWSRVFQQLPGGGHDYPLAPGSLVVIATDAIDHRPFFPGSLDLRDASFEFTGIPDVDNPVVPNMIDLSLEGTPSHGMGTVWGASVVVPFIAWPVDVAALVRTTPLTSPWARFPAKAILDVLSRGTSRPDGLPECPPLVAPNFDRALSHARGNNEAVEYEYSISRRVVPGSGGRRYLQNSRNSDADFIRTPRSPGRLPL